MKRIIRKILKENISNEKEYQFFKKLFLKNKERFLEHNLALHLDMHGGNIKSTDECLNDNHCYCKFLRSEKKWTKLLLDEFEESLKKRDSVKDVEGIFPYHLVEYGFNGYDSIFFYDQLLVELINENDC
jgi:hypothetical protein